MQGMNFITAVILLQTMDEEVTFWILYHIMYEKNWRQICKDGTPKLMEIIDEVKTKICDKSRRLYKHFLKHGIPLDSLISQFFTTLFIYMCPIDHSVRIIEMFLLEGDKLLHMVLIRFIVASKNKIL